MPALEWHRDHLNLFPNPRYRPACLFVTCNAFRSTPPSVSWPWKNANSHFIHLYLGDINPDLFLSKRSNSKSSIKRNIRPFSMENGRVVVRHSGKRINECRRERLPRFMKVKSRGRPYPEAKSRNKRNRLPTIPGIISEKRDK